MAASDKETKVIHVHYEKHRAPKEQRQVWLTCATNPPEIPLSL